MATILIVDDVFTNRETLVNLLLPHGYQVLEAANGREALAMVRARRPDLVITDLAMPVMNGFELVRRLRRHLATRAIPVIFFSSPYDTRNARLLALASGGCEVLTKTADPDDVLKMVSRALSGGFETPILSSESSRTVVVDRQRDEPSEKAEDLRSANARLRALLDIGLELASERDPDRLLENVCMAACDLFCATYVTLGIVDLNDRSVQRFATCGAEAERWTEVGNSVTGMLETVVGERRLLRGDNPGGDPATLRLPATHPRIQAFLAAPVVSPTQVYGWFCLVGNEGRSFTRGDEDLVLALSGQIGRIYENSHFHALAQSRAAELEAEILERKDAQTALRHERDRSQRYLDTAGVMFLALDTGGRITLVNRYACSVLGWAADELLGRSWTQTCLPPRVWNAAEETFRQLDGDLPVVETPVLTRSGEERLIEWRNTVVRDDTGQVVGWFYSGADVTERSQAVEAVRTAEERMRFALQSAGVGIWDLDYSTGAHVWSEMQEALYGLQAGSFGGTFDAFTERIHADDREAVLATIEEAARTGSEFALQYRIVWPDDTVRWLNGFGRIQLDDNGEPVRAVGISLDVTGRRALEAQNQQAQKMEAVGQLAGGVAHDFNNLLTTILGYCELLLTDIDPGDPRCEDIVEIQKAGTRAARLTRQLLAFSRKEIIKPALIDINDVVADMQAMLGRLIREDIEVALRLHPDVASVLADRGQLEQIVMNLALNARDGMPQGGTLTIQTSNVELDEQYAKTHLHVKSGAYVALTVRDSGIGMTPEVQARIFEPFFTTKSVGSGTGLGLATVHGIVTRSGGSIDVCSKVGSGTAFTVYFPRADAAEVRGEAPVRTLRGGAETVLVVEDAEDLRQLIRRLIQREGYTVLVAANAEEALGLFERNESIDVLLTDVVMPGASGPELTRRLVALRPGLKVIYMSGYAEDAIVQHDVLRSGFAFLHKPFSARTLDAKIREVLDRVGRASAEAA